VIIDGRETSYYEWLAAGMVDLRQQYAAIHLGTQVLQRLWYGFDERQYCIRLDVESAPLTTLSSWTIDVVLSHACRVRIASATTGVSAHLLGASPQTLSCAFGRILELAVPLDALALKEGGDLELTVTLSGNGELLERYPTEGHFTLLASLAALQAQAWSA
jgi:hypothetical protein